MPFENQIFQNQSFENQTFQNQSFEQQQDQQQNHWDDPEESFNTLSRSLSPDQQTASRSFRDYQDERPGHDEDEDEEDIEEDSDDFHDDEDDYDDGKGAWGGNKIADSIRRYSSHGSMSSAAISSDISPPSLISYHSKGKGKSSSLDSSPDSGKSDVTWGGIFSQLQDNLGITSQADELKAMQQRMAELENRPSPEPSDVSLKKNFIKKNDAQMQKNHAKIVFFHQNFIKFEYFTS